MRLIDANSLIEYWLQNGENEYVYDTNAFIESVDNAPTVDAEPVRHGRWVMESDGGTRCSSCKKKVHDTTNGCYEPVDLSEMPYCPKCGAKMDGDE